MSHPVHLRLYASVCARNDFYLDRIRDTADALGLNYTWKKCWTRTSLRRRGSRSPACSPTAPAAGPFTPRSPRTTPPPAAPRLWRPTAICCSGTFPPPTTPCGPHWHSTLKCPSRQASAGKAVLLRTPIHLLKSCVELPQWQFNATFFLQIFPGTSFPKISVLFPEFMLDKPTPVTYNMFNYFS